jgi:hypothetical protein
VVLQLSLGWLFLAKLRIADPVQNLVYHPA